MIRTEGGAYEPGIDKLIREVETCRRPVKRTVVLWPTGAMQEFKCTVCVCFETHGNSIIVGIEVHESFNHVPTEPFPERSISERSITSGHQVELLNRVPFTQDTGLRDTGD